MDDLEARVADLATRLAKAEERLAHVMEHLHRSSMTTGCQTCAREERGW